MAGRQPATVVESTVKPQRKRNGAGGATVYVAIDADILSNEGMDPQDPETIPDEVTEQYHKNGPREGEFVINLKEAVADE